MKFHGLRSRSTLTILLIYAAVGAVSLLAFLGTARAMSGRLATRFAEKNVLLDRERLLGPLRREVALARLMAESEAVREFCRREEDGAARARAFRELEACRQAFADRSWFLVVDRSLHHYYADDAVPSPRIIETLVPSSVNDRWYFSFPAQGRPYALNVDSDVALDSLKVWINVGVRDGNTTLGMAGTGIALSGFVRELKQGGDKDALTILVNEAGTLQAFPNAAYMEFNARTKDEARRMTLYQLLDRESDRDLLRERMARLTKGESGQETFRLALEGKGYLASAVYIKEFGWVALTLVDQDKVVGLRSFLPLLALFAAGLLATIALVSWLLDRMILRPLARLSRSSEAMAAGNYGDPVPVEREDEIGQLTASFNAMAGTVLHHTRNLEALVAERTRELTLTNRKLTDSLEYAHLVQASTLPKAIQMAAALPDHFLIFRPRDIVGGDFYALLQDGDGLLLAVGDCTGHGVPGAFMSMSAAALLNQVAARVGNGDPARILREMNRAFKALLAQDGPDRRLGEMDNGLDLGLLRLERGRAVFAGARVPLWILAPGSTEVQVLSGDPQSLGYRRSRADFEFRNQEVRLAPGAACYLLTDGFLDQNGGVHNFGFGRRRLQQRLLAHRSLSMAAQGAALERDLDQYRAGLPQRDDITLLGFRPGAGKE
jgi:serine phosphatase RsbU (regulator of sigma subunit)